MRGMISGSIIGGIKGDTTSLDYSACRQKNNDP